MGCEVRGTVKLIQVPPVCPKLALAPPTPVSGTKRESQKPLCRITDLLLGCQRILSATFPSFSGSYQLKWKGAAPEGRGNDNVSGS